MLLKFIPVLAITLTVTSLALTVLWPAPQSDGLSAPAHSGGLLF